MFNSQVVGLRLAAKIVFVGATSVFATSFDPGSAQAAWPQDCSADLDTCGGCSESQIDVGCKVPEIVYHSLCCKNGVVLPTSQPPCDCRGVNFPTAPDDDSGAGDEDSEDDDDGGMCEVPCDEVQSPPVSPTVPKVSTTIDTNQHIVSESYPAER